MEAGSQTHSLGRWSTLNLQCPGKIMDIIKFLLTDNVNLNEPRSLLASAVSILPEESIQSLLSHTSRTADANSRYEDGESCLHTSVRVNSAKKYDMIVENGADPSIKWNNLTSLETAIMYYPNGNVVSQLDKYLEKYGTVELLSLAR